MCPSEKCSGYVVPADPLDDSSAWRCPKCGFEVGAAEATSLVAGLEQEADQLQQRQATEVEGGGGEDLRESLEMLLSKMGRLLHPNHSAAVDIKFSLAQLYGRARAADARLVQEGKRKRKLCLEVRFKKTQLWEMTEFKSRIFLASCWR